MVTLTGSSPASSSRVFAGNCSDGRISRLPGGFWSRAEARFVGCGRVSSPRFLQSVVHLRHRAVRSQPPASCSLLPIKAQANLETAETEVQDSCQSETVRVRFELRKECMFGEQFLIVGDDPILGSWDPSGAVALDWSDGHVWAVEMDVPVGRLIKFKFILKAHNGTIFWQPGEDRNFQTWETKNMITVVEDWENPKIQNTVEIELSHIPNEEPNSGLDMTTAEENATHILQEEVEENMSENNGTASASKILDNDAISESQITDEGPILVPGLMPLSLESDETSIEVPGQKSLSLTDEGPVLVPGLIPLSIEPDEASIEVPGQKSLSLTDEGPVLVPGLIPLSIEPDEASIEVPGQKSSSVVSPEELPVVSPEGSSVASPGESSLASPGESSAASPEELPPSSPEGSSVASGEESSPEEAGLHTGERRRLTHALEESYEHKSQSLPKEESAGNNFGENDQLARKLEHRPTTESNEQDQIHEEPSDTNVLQNDVNWGRKALVKFLTSLGLV